MFLVLGDNGSFRDSQDGGFMYNLSSRGHSRETSRHTISRTRQRDSNAGTNHPAHLAECFLEHCASRGCIVAVDWRTYQFHSYNPGNIGFLSVI